ncbi:MAG: Tm-1-like ATP-binding domain-containing protein [Chloroflexi bacterium]|nr:Tm-1-like ATP-binding domain-containing protein [Chloroflexota bacterium]
MPKNILIIGTLDTKGEELGFIKGRIQQRGHRAVVMDVGAVGAPAFQAEIGREEVAWAGGTSLSDLQAGGDRGRAMETMTRGAAQVAQSLYAQGRVDGVIGLGGSAGASVGTAAMRALPTGVPKVMVTTMASGDTRPYVGTKDVTMMYSAVDIAGLNRLSRRILANAAGAICGMVEEVVETVAEKPLLGASMFGVTTPCVTAARAALERNGYEVLVFHATGSGGQAMESLVEDGFITGVLDLTTTEWADELVGGVLNAGPHRLEAAGKAGCPQLIAPGALDMVNFGPESTVPERFKGRKFHVHNPTVTLMRTTVEENRQLGRIIAEKANAAKGPVAILLPLRGVSAIDKEGQPFNDPAADAALFEAIRSTAVPQVRLIELDAHINDDVFAETAANILMEMMKK